MPKIIIGQSELPATDLNGGLAVRVRVVSESRNAISDWSQIYMVYPPRVGVEENDDGSFFTQANVPDVGIVSAKISDEIAATSTSAAVGAKWNIALSWADKYNLPQYDLYVRWYSGASSATPDGESDNWSEWEFLDSITTKTYSFNSPPIFSSNPIYWVDIAVTKSTYTKKYEVPLGKTGTALTVFNTYGHSHRFGE